MSPKGNEKQRMKEINMNVRRNLKTREWE